METAETAYWNPDQAGGTPNPHVLIIGESGTGKTYTTSCLVAELAQKGVTSIIFDYGQGFALPTLPREFVEATDVEEIHASRDGVDINPLQIFPSDVHGPVNVAQRVADTFARQGLARRGRQEWFGTARSLLPVVARSLQSVSVRARLTRRNGKERRNTVAPP